MCASRSAWIAASVWAGDVTMCDQSRMVVIPAFIADSALMVSPR
jgi:hypothetical protein